MQQLTCKMAWHFAIFASLLLYFILLSFTLLFILFSPPLFSIELNTFNVKTKSWGDKSEKKTLFRLKSVKTLDKCENI